MGDIDRRLFLKTAARGVAVGAVGVGAIGSGATPAVARAAGSRPRDAAGSIPTRPIMAYVRPGTRDVTVFVGEREIVRRDPELSRLLQQAAR